MAEEIKDMFSELIEIEKEKGKLKTELEEKLERNIDKQIKNINLDGCYLLIEFEKSYIEDSTINKLTDLGLMSIWINENDDSEVELDILGERDE